MDVTSIRKDLLRMEPRWPDPPTLLSTALRESVQADGQLIHLLDLASANLAYMFSKAANGLLSKESLGEETNKHHGLMHLWDDNIEVLQRTHNKGREQIDKSLAILSQTQEEQDGTSEAETQLRLLRTRLYEVFGLFNPPRPLKVSVDRVPILEGASQRASTENDLMGSLSAPIDLTQEAVANEQLHAMKTNNPICPTLSFGGQPIPRDPSKVKQSAVPSTTGHFSDRNSRPYSFGQGIRSDASHSATDSYSAKPLSSNPFGNPPAPTLAPSILSGSTGFNLGHEAQTTAQNPTANKQSAKPSFSSNLNPNAGFNPSPLFGGPTNAGYSTKSSLFSALNKQDPPKDPLASIAEHLTAETVKIRQETYFCTRRRMLMETALQGKLSITNATLFADRFERKVQELIKHEEELLHAAARNGP